MTAGAGGAAGIVGSVGGGSSADGPAKGGGPVLFPFTAVVGADDLGLALCLSAVSPAIGGVLVRGEKGTAKTTMVRGLARVLPRHAVIRGCRFGCDPARPDPACPDTDRHETAVPAVERATPLVELPVGASEDRVVGSLHLDALLSSGRVSFEPGLLAAANRGVLYVDEVNLLPDHLVDTLLDAAATGTARVEREGVSVGHAARFVLVGTMNPEEGDLRPQLLDRFGLVVDVAASRDPRSRVEVMRRRLGFEADPSGFAARYAASEERLTERIARARAAAPGVGLPDAAMTKIATICAEFDVDGLRGDLVTARTALAHAAWRGVAQVADRDIRAAARLALPHRRRRNPFDTPESAAAELEEILDRVLGPEPPPDDPDPQDPEQGPDGPDARDEPGAGDDGGRDDGSGDDGGTPPPDTAPPEPPQPPPSSEASDADRPDGAQRADGAQDASRPHEPDEPDEPETPDAPAGPGAARPQATQRAGAPFAARLLTLDRVGRGAGGRRSRALTTVGRHLRGVPAADPRGRGVAVGDTIRAAAGQQLARGRAAGDVAAPLVLAGSDLRRSLREGKEGNLVVFCVDTSGSMGARRRMADVKTAVLSLLVDAYQRRDKVAVVTFARGAAQVLLPPTGSVEMGRARLDAARTGGRTPLAEGLTAAADLIRREKARDPLRRPLLVVLTDGRATHGANAVARSRAAAARIAGMGVSSVVLDCESPRGVRLHLARDLAGVLGARLLPLDEVDLASAARPRRHPGAA
ncbi:VWA domain-containing protein [Agilicoccus flavus]|uniref:VWA domain-containing protein n=1 Tax=Agilicoccus flavus TaxID=2775968 RepID=UPI001CF6C80A|nr:VWA domain-containing protein [Agilicoccus flavus]